MSALSDPAGRLRTSGSLTPRPVAPALAPSVVGADVLPFERENIPAVEPRAPKPTGGPDIEDIQESGRARRMVGRAVLGISQNATPKPPATPAPVPPPRSGRVAGP